MVKKVILAVAGSGKTYHICHAINREKRNLILAFTKANVANIKRELEDAFGSMPRHTIVQTFDSFVYQNFILPHERTIRLFFGSPGFKSTGITMVDPPPKPKSKKKSGKTSEVRSEDGEREDGQRIKATKGRYFPKDKLQHYITNSHEYYCATLSELALYVDFSNLKNNERFKKEESLIVKALRRLGIFYDSILIDEFQDFRRYDFDLLMRLVKGDFDLVMVGDYFQHSVAPFNNYGKPFDNKDLKDFVSFLKKQGFEVDQSTLLSSRRCSVGVCDFVSKKLNVPIESSNENIGEVLWADNRIKEILDDDRIVKLFYNVPDGAEYKVNSWSYSKGDTYDAVCVFLTKKFEKLGCESFNLETERVGEITRNKLYVAMTRTRGDLFLVRQSAYKAYLEGRSSVDMKCRENLFSQRFTDQPSLFEESELPMGPKENK